MISIYRKRWVSLSLALILLLMCNQSILSQVSKREKKEVEKAATSLYHEYLKHPELRYKEKSKLDKLISPHLNGLLDDDLRRRRVREKKNPPNNQIIHYLLTCNGDEPPQGVHVSRIKKYGKTFRVTIRFEYIGGGKVLDRCELVTIFNRVKGKWLLDNVLYKTGDDLVTALARKFQEPLPE